MIIELVLTPHQVEVIDELEQHWRVREATRCWDASDEVCERLLLWLRSNGCIADDLSSSGPAPTTLRA